MKMLRGSWNRGSPPTAIPDEREGANESQGSCDQVSVSDLERLLLWQEPLRSARVFGAGLYIFICLRQLVNGVDIFQPTSAAASVAICMMVYNVFQSWRTGSGQSISRLEAEKVRQRKVEAFLAQAVVRIVPLTSAIISLVARRLSGYSGKASRVWLGVCLWATIMVGELGLLSQSSLVLWLWVALFTLPMVYTTCRAALDALVDEFVSVVLSAVRGGQKGTVLVSAGLGVSTFVMLNAKFLVRISLAALSSCAVLVAQAYRHRLGLETSI